MWYGSFIGRYITFNAFQLTHHTRGRDAMNHFSTRANGYKAILLLKVLVLHIIITLRIFYAIMVHTLNNHIRWSFWNRKISSVELCKYMYRTHHTNIHFCPSSIVHWKTVERCFGISIGCFEIYLLEKYLESHRTVDIATFFGDFPKIFLKKASRWGFKPQPSTVSSFISSISILKGWGYFRRRRDLRWFCIRENLSSFKSSAKKKKDDDHQPHN